MGMEVKGSIECHIASLILASKLGLIELFPFNCESLYTRV